jgi:hypothetical protein
MNGKQKQVKPVTTTKILQRMLTHLDEPSAQSFIPKYTTYPLPTKRKYQHILEHIEQPVQQKKQGVIDDDDISSFSSFSSSLTQSSTSSSSQSSTPSSSQSSTPSSSQSSTSSLRSNMASTIVFEPTPTISPQSSFRRVEPKQQVEARVFPPILPPISNVFMKQYTMDRVKKQMSGSPTLDKHQPTTRLPKVAYQVDSQAQHSQAQLLKTKPKSTKLQFFSSTAAVINKYKLECLQKK